LTDRKDVEMSRYFVSYAYNSVRGETGFSWAQLELSDPIRSHIDIQNTINKLLELDKDRRAITILSWKKFEEEES